MQQALDASGRPVAGARALVNGYGPQQFHMAYQLPCKPGGPVAAVCAAPASYGPETISVVEMSGYAGGVDQMEADFQAFNQQYGLPSCSRANGCLQVVNADGNTSPLPGGTDWTGETSLDMEAAHEICQTCKLIVVQAGSGTGETAGNWAITQKGALATALMLYIQDYSGTAPQEYVDATNVTGGAFLAATGDAGTAPAGSNIYPAFLPGVVAVAGTTLRVNTDNTWAGETVWAGSGGGCSTQYKAPSWQKAVPNWSSAGCGSQRAYGDISLDADPATGAAVYSQGTWGVVGGTSLSTPLLIGMYGLAGTNAVPDGVPAGQVLYQKANATNTHDIVSGNDCNASTADCTAGPGFDVPSGLGAPIGLTAIGGPTTVSGKPGDLNGDGKVNIQDLAQLLINFGKTGSGLKGDLNSDGKVNI